MVTCLFVAVECKKPWDYLNLTIFRKRGSKKVSFALAGSRSLAFTRNNYIKEFGRRNGTLLYDALAKQLEACRDESISTDTIRMQLCIVIWNHFGIRWLEIFSCIQQSRNETPPGGVDDLAVFNLYAYLNICLVPLVCAEIKLVYGSDFVLRAGFTPQCSGQVVIASWRFTFLF